MRKRRFYSELAYVFSIMSLGLGAALMEKADFGVSMVVAPAYLFYLKLSQKWSFFTFGMAEYITQGCLLLAMILILRQFKISYLFSFMTALICGFTLDIFMGLIAPISIAGFAGQMLFYSTGLILCAMGVALVFNTYIAPAVYDMFVKLVSGKLQKDISRFKLGYDCVSCLIAIILSFLFFGLFQFEGVKWGTVICALINGRLIGFFSTLLNRHLEFVDRLPLRKYFEQPKSQEQSHKHKGISKDKKIIENKRINEDNLKV